MKHEVDSLKSLFRGILVALAVPAAGCGASVQSNPTDAAVTPTDVSAADVSTATDVPVAQDVPIVRDVPATPDVPSVRDVPATPDVPSVRDVPAVQDVPVLADVATGDAGCAVTPNTESCNERVRYACGIPELPDGMNNVGLDVAQCTRLCALAYPMGGRPDTSCSAYRETPGQAAVIVNCALCAIGRRTQDFAAQDGAGADLVGRYFAVAAQLEAASVAAFRTLGAELRAHGAPEDLVAEAARAADDERRHARSTAAIARARGCEPPRVRLTPASPRGRAEMAMENAVEGCVRETFGALVAHWQRAHAEDQSIRAAMDVIAEDETRHAALAWSVAAWLDGTLSAEDRDAVRAARDAAVDALAQDLDAEVPEALTRAAGMPPRRVSLALLDGLRGGRWARA
jgi:hypothetical protein